MSNWLSFLGCSVGATERGLLDTLGHPLLRHLAEDLLELGFQCEAGQWSRWAAAAFVNGLRLGHREGCAAFDLLATPPPLIKGDHSIVLDAMPDPFCAPCRNLEILREAFDALMSSGARVARGALERVAPEKQLARWFASAAWWGMHAGIAADHLKAGYLLALTDGLSLSQTFIGDRLISLARTTNSARRPVLIALIEYSYPHTPRERRVVTACATHLLGELARMNLALDTNNWILGGFRAGLLLSARQPALRQSLFEESSPQGLRDVRALFDQYIGPHPGHWSPQRLVAQTLSWLGRAHPDVVELNCRGVEFERIRRLFNFGFWMGLVACADRGCDQTRRL